MRSLDRTEAGLLVPRVSRPTFLLPGHDICGGGSGVKFGGNDSFTKLLLHCDGSNGSTTFLDSSADARTMTVSGDPAISTVQYKFGGASGLFGGSSDYMTAPNSADFEFGSGDFTIDWWEYRTASTAVRPVFSRGPVNSNPLMVGYSDTTNIVAYGYTSAPWDLLSAFILGSITLNAWTHYAISRSGNFFYGFKNGTLTTTSGSTSAAVAASAATPSIGAEVSTAGSFPGYLDEVRVSKGIARWTANFTLPQYSYD